MRTFAELQQEIATINRANGWSDTPRTTTQSRLLIDSELSELFEWHRNGNGVSDHIPPYSGVEEELADVLIRLLDTCERHGIVIHDVATAAINSTYVGSVEWCEENNMKTFRQMRDFLLTPSKYYDREHALCVAKTVLWAPSTLDSDRALYNTVWRLLDWVIKVAYSECIYLPSVVDDKLDFNRTRPHRHGGKTV